MNQNLYLYQGKDYWLIPRLEKKEIIMKNIQTQLERRIQFTTKFDVKANCKEWLDNQEIRLPNTFIILASEYDRDMINAFKKLGINPPNKKHLKDKILFHNLKNTYHHMHLEDIDANLIPIIHYKDIHKVVSYTMNRLHEETHIFTKRQGIGLFADQVY